MKLSDAIAELRRAVVAGGRPWRAFEFESCRGISGTTPEAIATTLNAVLDGTLVAEAEARGWKNGMLTATSHVAEARNSHAQGPIFKALNETLGKIDDARFAALRAEVPK